MQLVTQQYVQARDMSSMCRTLQEWLKQCLGSGGVKVEDGRFSGSQLVDQCIAGAAEVSFACRQGCNDEKQT